MFILFGQNFTKTELFIYVGAFFALCEYCFAFLLRPKAAVKFSAAVYGILLAVVLLLPVKGGGGAVINLTFMPVTAYNLKHTAENILLFVPLTFLFAVYFKRPVTVLVFAAAASLLLEALQLFVVGRVTDIQDVAANVFGAAVGAAAAVLINVNRRSINEIFNERRLLARDKLRRCGRKIA